MIKYLSTSSEFDSILKENKRVLIDFYADWCGPCQMLMPILEEVSDENEDLIVLKVNTDKFGDIAMKYNLYSIPCLIYYKNGELINKVIGYVQKQKVIALISKN